MYRIFWHPVNMTGWGFFFFFFILSQEKKHLVFHENIPLLFNFQKQEGINWLLTFISVFSLLPKAASPPPEGQQIKANLDAVNPSAPRQGFLFYLRELRTTAAQRYRVSKSSQAISWASVSPTADRGELTGDDGQAGNRRTAPKVDTEVLQTWT